MPYGLSPFSQTSTSYQNKKKQVQSFYGYTPPASYDSPNISYGYTPPSSGYTERANQWGEVYQNRQIKSRSTLDRIFDTLQVGQYVVQGALYHSTDNDPKTNMFTGAWEGLKGANPFGQDYRKGEYRFSQVLGNLGWEPESKLGKVARGIVGFAGDVALDPVTYMSFGLGSLVKGTGTVNKAGKILKGLDVVDATNILRKAGIEATDDVIQDLITRSNKLAGIVQPDAGRGIGVGFGKNRKTFIEAETLRLLGDETIAPYFKQLGDYVVESNPLLAKLDPEIALKRLGRKDINQLGSELVARDIQNGFVKSSLDANAKVRTRVRDLLGDFSEDELIKITNILEDSDKWLKKSLNVGVGYTDDGKKVIDDLKNTINIIDDRILTLESNLEQVILAQEKYSGLSSDLAKLAFRLDDSPQAKRLNNLIQTREQVVKSHDIFESALNNVTSNVEDIGKFTKGVHSRLVSKPIGSDVWHELPYGTKAKGNGIYDMVGNRIGDINELKNSPFDSIRKINNRRPYGTSVSALKKAIESGDTNTMYTSLNRVIENNPYLKADFERMPLATNLTPKQLARFIDEAQNESVETFLRNSHSIREGSTIAERILDAEGLAFKEGADKAFIDTRFKRKTQLLLDEDLRLQEYLKVYKKEGRSYAKKSMSDIKDKFDFLKKQRSDIKQSIKLGTSEPGAKAILDGIEYELVQLRNKHADILGLDDTARKYAKGMDVISEKEIDNILRTDYAYGTQTLDDAYFDFRDLDTYTDRAVDMTGTVNRWMQGKGYNNLDEASEISEYLVGKNVEKIVRDASRAEAKLTVAEDTLQLAKDLFPNKAYKQLTPKEQELLEILAEQNQHLGKTYDPVAERSLKSALKESDIKIKDLDQEIINLEGRLAKVRAGDFKREGIIKNQMKELESFLNSSKNTEHYKTRITELAQKQSKIQKAFELDKVDEYLEQVLSPEEYSKISTVLSDKVLDDTGLTESMAKVINELRMDFDKIAVDLPDFKYLSDYVPHMIKPEYKSLFYNEELINDIAKLSGAGSGKYNVHELERLIPLSIKEYKDLWKATDGKAFEYGGKQLPYDLWEENISKLYTSRMIYHNQMISDPTNYKKIMDLVSEPVSIKTTFRPDEHAVISMREIGDTLERVSNYNNTTWSTRTITDSIKKGNMVDARDLFINAGIDVDYYNAFGDTFVKIKNIDQIKNDVGLLDALQAKKITSATLEQMNTASRMQMSNGMESFLHTYDKFLHLWKLNVTVVNPGFHTRNTIGNMFNNYLDVGTKSFDVNYRKTIKNITDGADGFITTKTGEKISYEKVRSMAKDLNVFDDGFYGADIRKAIENANKDITKWQKFNPLNSTEFLPYKKGTQLGSYIENHDRMLNFVYHLEQGKSPRAAKDMVDQFLFDYSKATPFEQDIMRRIIPFWTWTKNNVPLQAENMIKQPKKYMPFVKARDEMEGLVDEQDRVDRNYLNSFAQDWIQLPGGITNEQGRKEVLMFNPSMPYQDISLTNKDILARISPFIKVPYELVTNKNIYYDQPIREEWEGQIAPRLDHIASQLSGYTTAKSIKNKQGLDRMLEILAYTTGLRILSYDHEKYKHRAILEDIKNAQQRGD